MTAPFYSGAVVQTKTATIFKGLGQSVLRASLSPRQKATRKASTTGTQHTNNCDHRIEYFETASTSHIAHSKRNEARHPRSY
jgi:hypothetical protein